MSSDYLRVGGICDRSLLGKVGAVPLVPVVMSDSLWVFLSFFTLAWLGLNGACSLCPLLVNNESQQWPSFLKGTRISCPLLGLS